MQSIIKHSFYEAKDVLDEFVNNPANFESIENAAKIMCDSISSGGKIISCGNGGSLCDATHFAEELTARFRENRRAIPAIAINDAAFITCSLNDFSPTSIFSRYVEAVGNKGDVLLAISTSGNSKNVLEAVAAAKARGMKVVALTGKGGGELSKVCDVEIRAPKSRYSDRCQEIHIKVIHVLVECIESGVCVDSHSIHSEYER